MNNLLLLHGALGSNAQFKELEEILAGFYNVFSLSFAGHGRQQFPEEEFSIPLFANQVINYLDINNIATIDIFGYSMGGYVAIYLALYFPERINKIFTFATKFDWSEESAKKESSMLNSVVIEEKVPAYAEQLKAMHGESNWKTLLDKTSEMMLQMAKKNLLDNNSLTTINHKVMIGIGDKDRMVSLEETISVFRALQRSTLIVFPNTAHPFDRIDLQRLSAEIKKYFIS